MDVVGGIDQLLHEAEQIERTARAMQDNRPSSFSDHQTREFRVRYEQWQAQAMNWLPEDLRAKFEREYEGGRFSGGIKAFLAAPTQPNVVFAGAVTDDQKHLWPLYWQYPVGTSFERPFITQQALLRQARERYAAAEGALGQRTLFDPGGTERGVVFIAHGRSQLYLGVYRYLRDELGLIAEAFETEDHTSQQITEILDQYLGRATAAVIVMTGEDRTIDDKLHARQNVVHEAGLFQAKLGFDRVALLKEQGVEKFTNIDGLVYIPFDPDDVTSCFYKLRRFLVRHGLVSS